MRIEYTIPSPHVEAIQAQLDYADLAYEDAVIKNDADISDDHLTLTVDEIVVSGFLPVMACVGRLAKTLPSDPALLGYLLGVIDEISYMSTETIEHTLEKNTSSGPWFCSDILTESTAVDFYLIAFLRAIEADVEPFDENTFPKIKEYLDKDPGCATTDFHNPPASSSSSWCSIM